MTLRDRITAALDGTGLCADSAEDRERIAEKVLGALAVEDARSTGRRQPCVFSMNPQLVDVLDDVARGLGVPRSRVAEAYLEEALRSRCLWPLTPRVGTRPVSTIPTPSPQATSAADASSSEQGATTNARASARRKHKRHTWDERVDRTREAPSLRSKHGAGQ